MIVAGCPSGSVNGDCGAPPERRLRLDGAALLSFTRQLADVTVALDVTAVGTSMMPTIPEGARVTLVTGRPPSTGDIVLIEASGKPVLHRVVSRSTDTVVTRGDACHRSDAATPRAEVLAVAIRSEHGRRVVALTPTLRYGVRALVRGAWFGARALIRTALVR